MSLPLNPDSPLVKIAKASSPGEDQTGVRMLPLGAFSLDTRMQLAQRATTSLDVQYYQFENDPTGRLLMTALRDASIRGVRVRLLVDDLYTTHTDALLRGLASFPNVEVHLFNPFCCARGSGVAGRYTASIFDFGRLNHRMHNKLFVADGVMAVIGGRNIADEYFQRGVRGELRRHGRVRHGRRGQGAVGDLRPLLEQRGRLPDRADRRAARRQGGAAEVLRRGDREPAAGRRRSTCRRPTCSATARSARTSTTGQVGLQWGSARAFADPPEKLLSKTPQVAFETSVTNDVMMQVWQAKSELVITSPYMIPGHDGVTSFENLQQNKVKVIVVTNSLAATDEPLVHNGYSKYRTAMLKAGVDLYELSPTRTQKTKRLGMFGKSLGRLHAKTAVIDRHLVFVGSMNLDPRSASANTELGMFIDSPALAKELLRVDQHQPAGERLPGAPRPEDRAAAMADDGGRQRGRARGRAGVELLAAGAQLAHGLVRSRAAALTRGNPQGGRGTIRACPATPSPSPPRSRPSALCPWRWRSRCASSTASTSTRATAPPPPARPA